MSAATMNTALTNIEAALVSLGTAFASYEACRAAAKNDRAASSGLARAEDIDNSISSSQLCSVVAGRLVALGLSPVLANSPSSVGAVTSAWVTPWQAKVTAIVP